MSDLNSFFPSVQYLRQYQPENQLDQLAKAAGIRNAQQQQQQNAASFPLEQQQRQANLQSTQLANQQTQLSLQDRQGISQALKDSYGATASGSTSSGSGTTQPGSTAPPSASAQSGGVPLAALMQPRSASGPAGGAPPQSPFATPPTFAQQQAQPTNPADRLAALAARIQDPKYGISAAGQIQMMEQLNGLQQKLATTDKDTLGNIEAAHKVISQGLSSVLEAPPEDQPAQWTLERNELLRHPTLGKFLGNLPAQYPGQPAPGGSPEAQSALHSLMAEQDIVAAAKQKNEAPEQVAKATQAAQAAAPPTPQQIADATKTIQSYEGINPAERLGLIAEINHAPDFETLGKVQARADAAQSSGQMKQATLAQAKALAGNKFQEAGLTQNQKPWSDFSNTVAQANQTKSSIVAGADGNGLLTNMVPTMEVLGINMGGQIRRISPTEAAAAGTPPELATRWNAFISKAATGKLTPELAKEGNQLMDIVTDSAYQKAVMQSQLIAKGHQIDPSQMPAMDRQGNLTTLDKARSGGTQQQSSGTVTMRAPNGQTKQVSADQVDHYKSMGATVVNP
jgi:hypothetical protein